MILLVGATGRLGKALAERGVDVVQVDVESGAGLAKAIDGVTKVVSCIHGLLGKSRHSIQRIDIRGHERLIDASAQAGVQRFVLLSALGASPDHPSEFWWA